jgi:hypothetical protein
MTSRRGTIAPIPEYLDVPVLPWCTCAVLRPLSTGVVPVLLVHSPVASNRMDSDSWAVIRLDW